MQALKPALFVGAPNVEEKSDFIAPRVCSLNAEEHVGQGRSACGHSNARRSVAVELQRQREVNLRLAPPDTAESRHDPRPRPNRSPAKDDQIRRDQTQDGQRKSHRTELGGLLRPVVAVDVCPTSIDEFPQGIHVRNEKATVLRVHQSKLFEPSDRTVCRGPR